jgi:hypothetical protein
VVVANRVAEPALFWRREPAPANSASSQDSAGDSITAAASTVTAGASSDQTLCRGLYWLRLRLAAAWAPWVNS